MRGSTYHRLYRQTMKTKQVRDHYQRLELESQECTFTPRIIGAVESPRPAGSFDRLYQEAATKRQDQREKELQQSQRDLSDCTFQPEVISKTERSSHSESVHTALYSQHSQREQNVRKQQVERNLREMEEATFVPLLYTNSRVESSTPVYQRLYKPADSQRGENTSASHPAEAESLTDRPFRLTPSRPRNQSTGRFANN